MTRRAVTLIELLVVVATVATLIALAVGAINGQRRTGKQEGDQGPPASWNLHTVQHDGHWFVKDAAGGVCHHPDCPCHGRAAEAEVK